MRFIGTGVIREPRQEDLLRRYEIFSEWYAARFNEPVPSTINPAEWQAPGGGFDVLNPVEAKQSVIDASDGSRYFCRLYMPRELQEITDEEPRWISQFPDEPQFNISRFHGGDLPGFLLFQGDIYMVSETECEDDNFDLFVKAASIERRRDLARKIARAEASVALGTGSRSVGATKHRQALPDDVKIFVWRRDQGRCVKCGSNENLEFDHIIPVVMGGSDTARNIQLLCEPCNRAKGGNLV